MADIFVEVDVREIERLAHVAPRVIAKHWLKGFRGTMGEFDNTFTQRQLSGSPGLFRRSGALARSFQGVAVGKTLEDIKATYGTTSRYARIHEHGGTITAKGKKLAIPLSAAKTAAGVSRGGPRTYGGQLFLVVRKGRAPLLVKFSGGRTGRSTARQRELGAFSRGSRMTPMFVLLSSVTIKPRLRLVATWNELAPGIVHKHLKAATQAATAEAAKAAAAGGR